MMREKIKIAIKLILFTILAAASVYTVNEWMKPKYYYTETWPATNTYEDFYQLKKDTVDVLLLGSSHAVSALNPQVFYDNYGITSYNLGCESQSLVVTYYWLKEALKYQSPKVVVLDTYMLYKFGGSYVYNGMNCSESSVRKAMDSMRFSPLKWEAARTIEKIDPAQNALSFFLLNTRYHTRWTSLGESDYTEAAMVQHGGMKGYTVFSGSDQGATYTPFSASDADAAQPEEVVGTAKAYLDKIVDLCNQENINLVLVKIPSGGSERRYKAANEYAQSKGVPYLDFNEEVLYNEIGYDAGEDLLNHLNYFGAEKVSNYLGKLLRDEYGVESREDSSYNATRELYEHMIRNVNLQATTDAYQYLDRINRDEYSVFVLGATSYSAFIDDELMSKFAAMEFTTDLQGLQDGTHYCAVKDSSGIIENLTMDDVSFSGSVRGGLTPYKFSIDTSIMDVSTYSLLIDGFERGNQNIRKEDDVSKGLTIIVYDNEMQRIIDQVRIDTTVEELPIIRG